jgi:hypothetical protein
MPGLLTPVTRRWLTRLAVVVAVVAAAWTVIVLVNGPLRLRLAGTTITSTDPWRPALLALVCAMAACAFAGWQRAMQRVAAVEDGTLAAVIAAAVLMTGVSFATTAASGSDAYGYVSQAEGWIAGEVTINQQWAAEAPWPLARWTFSPLGYRPSFLDHDEWSLVPVYGAGLPLILAAAKLAGGQEAMFWVVPLSGALLVLATFGIGRRLGAPKAGLIAAWLVATSPTVLFMLMAPMTDVPVATAWAASFYFLLGRRPGAALAAGICAGLGILIRPNLVFGAAIFGLWYAVPLLRPGASDRRAPLLQGLLFSIGVLAGAAAVLLIQDALYGSPFLSGYGAIYTAFKLENFWPNATRYVPWLIDTQTPFILVGVLTVLVPLRRFWPAAPERLAFLLMGLFVVGVWTFYCLYSVYDEWWFLRFLLATWPFLMLGCGAAVVALAKRGGRAAAVALTLAVVSLGVYEVAKAHELSAFNLWKEERRYVSVARHVRRLTDRNAAIFTMQHSGSIRYYAGRMTIRYDQMDDGWLDRAVDWLAQRGIRSYLVLDDWEIPVAEKLFTGQRAADRLKEMPLLEYRGLPRVVMLDLSQPRDLTVPPTIVHETYEDTRSVEPAPPPRLDLQGARTTK